MYTKIIHATRGAFHSMPRVNNAELLYRQSRTSRKRLPTEMSSLGARLRELRPYWFKILPFWHMVTAEKKSLLPIEKFVCCTIQERDVTPPYYMALSHKDWELPNSRI